MHKKKKSKVYVNSTQSIDDLKMKFTQEMDSAKQDEMLIKRAVRDMVRRPNMRLDVWGHHISETLLILKKKHT